MELFELTKKDWTKLSEAGLICDGFGNGFANTTKKFDDEICCSRNKKAFIRLANMQYIYVVQYVDGCFYPIWHKTYYATGDSIYELDKNNLIFKFSPTKVI